MSDDRYQLKPLASDEEGRTYHDIRRRVLFLGRGRGVGVYQEDHPDETATDNHPLLLTVDGKAIGTVRLDLIAGGSAAIRLVAIDEGEQGQGHGRHLLRLAEQFVRKRGADRMVVNAAPEAVNFYRRAGYKAQAWDDPSPPKSTSVQMAKDL